MTPDVQVAAERVAAFLDAWEDPAEGRGAISTLRSEGLRLTPLDLRLVLAALDPADVPINPTTWTAPDGTVLDLTRQVFDSEGDAWMLAAIPPLTMTMVDGDRSDRTLPYLFKDLGPLTNEGEEV